MVATRAGGGPGDFVVAQRPSRSLSNSEGPLAGDILRSRSSALGTPGASDSRADQVRLVTCDLCL